MRSVLFCLTDGRTRTDATDDACASIVLAALRVFSWQAAPRRSLHSCVLGWAACPPSRLSKERWNLISKFQVPTTRKRLRWLKELVFEISLNLGGIRFRGEVTPVQVSYLIKQEVSSAQALIEI